MGFKVNQVSRLVTKGSSIDGESAAISILFLLLMLGFGKGVFEQTDYGIVFLIFCLMAFAVILSLITALLPLVKRLSKKLCKWFKKR